jgi:glycosyltransferase involved in cell wall biosynthesis
MKLVFLHNRLSPYFAACLRELKSRGVDLMIYAKSTDEAAPFDDRQFQGLGEIHCSDSSSSGLMVQRVKEFKPDAIHVGGWSNRSYMGVCRRMRAEGALVIAGCDTQWNGSFRQYLARFASKLHLKRAIDICWVPGERQKTLFSFLGYRGEKCWDGSYACDWDLYSSARKRDAQKDQVPYFLFVGRYVHEKGIDTLAKAFKIYGELVPDPWDLVCAGRGPLADAIQSAGAQDRGFVQPQNLPDLMSGAGGFVLPSRFEPWGVVIQEAAAVGLPLICSDACGAAVHLLRDHYNGYTFPAGSARTLAERMAKMSLIEDEQRSKMGERSFQLSKQYTPERWADILIDGIERAKG